MNSYVFICRYEFITMGMNSYVLVGLSTKEIYVKHQYGHEKSYVDMSLYVRGGIYHNNL